MRKKWLKIINILLILGVISLIIWLVNLNFPYYDNLIVQLNPAKDQPMISRLGPEPRIKIEKDYYSILEGPVYFDLRSLPWFSQAKIYLIFKEEGLQFEGIGPQMGATWQYDVKKPYVVLDDADGFKKAVFNFALFDIYQQKNVRRFLISVIPINPESKGELKIKDLKIILSL